MAAAARGRAGEDGREAFPRDTASRSAGGPKENPRRTSAEFTGASFLCVSGAGIFSPYLGDAEAAVRELFKRARLSAPSIVFLDEIDAIVGKRSSSSSGSSGSRDDVRERVLSTILNEMDGVEQSSSGGVIVVGATNRPDLLDDALVRPGRFGRSILVGLPDEKARSEIFRVHTRRMPIDRSAAGLADEISKSTEGFSGAEIACLCREAAMTSLREDIKNRVVLRRHFEEALSHLKRRPGASVKSHLTHPFKFEPPSQQ